MGGGRTVRFSAVMCSSIAIFISITMITIHHHHPCDDGE